MKKILALLFLVSVFCSEKSIGQGFLFSKIYDWHCGIISSIVETDDGNLMTGGSIYYNPVQYGVMRKLDLSGNIIWQKNFYSLNSISSLVQTDDNGFIIYGPQDTTISGTSYSSIRLRIIKTNSVGDSLWTVKIVGNIGLNNLSKTSDGGVIACYNDTASQSRIGLIKISSTGNIEWQYFYAGNGYSWCNKLITSYDNGFIACGKTNSNYGYLIKTDSSGIMLWDTAASYGGEFSCLTQLTDNSIIAINRIPNSNLGIWKYNSSGIVISLDSMALPGGFASWNIQSMSDGGFIITGHYLVNPYSKFYCAKFNSQCQFMWDYKYDNPNQFSYTYNDCFDAIQSTANGNYYLTGGIKDTNDCYKPTLICISQFPTQVSSISSTNSCKIFSSLDGAVQIHFNQTENYSLDIFDLNGKLISHSAGNNSEVNENFNLPSGVYLIKVGTKDFTASQLFPIVR